MSSKPSVSPNSHPTRVISLHRAIFNSISAIDQRIEQLSAELLSVQTQRNNSVPFLKLPNEILCIIIEIHARECAPHRSRFSLHWIKTLLVCRRWYALAVTKQSLWANILIRAVSMPSLAREGFLRLQAERSGAAPLSLKAELYNEEYDLEWMASLFARLVSFDVSGQNAHIQDVIDRLPGNASFLAALKISANESGEGLGEFVELPPEVLLQLRSLRVLSLHSVAYSWTAPRNLTALEMDRCICVDLEADDRPASVDDILAVLRNSPSLRVFILTPIDELIPVATTAPVDLPHLQYLEINRRRIGAAALLNSLRFPATASVCINTPPVLDIDHTNEFLVPLQRHFRNTSAGAPALHVLLLRSYSWPADIAPHWLLTMALAEHVGHRGVTGELHVLHQNTSGTYDHSRIVSLTTQPMSGQCVDEILAGFINAARAEAITHLDVSHVSGFVESNWRALLDLLPNLHSIQMKFSKEGAHRQNQDPDPEAVYTGMWLLRVLRANASLDASCRIRTLSLEVMPPYYGARELDLAWLARWLVELEAYVRVRREEFGRGSAALELIEIEDWEELLKRDGLEDAVSRLEGLMEGMGLLKRYRGIGPNAKVES